MELAFGQRKHKYQVDVLALAEVIGIGKSQKDSLESWRPHGHPSETILLTAVAFLSPATAATINFCGDQRGACRIKPQVRAEFTTGVGGFDAVSGRHYIR